MTIITWGKILEELTAAKARIAELESALKELLESQSDIEVAAGCNVERPIMAARKARAVLKS